MHILHTFKIVLTLLFISLSFASCNTTTDPDDNGAGSMTGTLVYDLPSADSQVGTFSFSSKEEVIVFDEGKCPSWTPSGEVLYEEPSGHQPSWSIVQIAQNGTNKRVLLDSKMFSLNVAKSPKMSKDGSTICFNYWNGGGASELYSGHGTILMNSNGTLIGGLDSLFDGSWMPDGSLVLSATVEELWTTTSTFYADGLYLLSADYTSITPIGSGLVKPKHPAASPDGKRIAFSMNKHIWVINADGTGLRQVTTGSKEEARPCWSPDGKYIACICFGTFEASYYNALAAVPADEAAAINLTNDSKYWVIDPSQSTNSSLGRLNPYSSISWK